MAALAPLAETKIRANETVVLSGENELHVGATRIEALWEPDVDHESVGSRDHPAYLQILRVGMPPVGSLGFTASSGDDVAGDTRLLGGRSARSEQRLACGEGRSPVDGQNDHRCTKQRQDRAGERAPDHDASHQEPCQSDTAGRTADMSRPCQLGGDAVCHPCPAAGHRWGATGVDRRG